MDQLNPVGLCDRCRVLEFDDSTVGSHVESDNGQGYLLFDDSQFLLDYELQDDLPDLPLLSASARDGCGFCSLLCEAIRDCKFEEQTIKVGLEITCGANWYGYKLSGLLSLLVHLYLDLEADIDLVFTIDSGFQYLPPPHVINLTRDHFYGHNLQHDGPLPPAARCKEWLRLQSPPRDTALCDANVSMMRQLLGVLESPLPAASWTPSRLIDVRPQDGSDCRLIVTERTMALPSSYLALSYCWGPQKDADAQFKTDKITFDHRLRGFPLEEVSPLVRDAIEVTRAVGVPYLWVDALCIIQGDKQDWARESGQMDLIYQHALATICVASSESCQHGFLARNERSICVNFQSRIDINVNGTYSIRWYSTMKPSRNDPFRAHFDLDSKCRWNNRAWTLQESQLSKVQILFGRSKLYYLRGVIMWPENENFVITNYSRAGGVNDIEDGDNFDLSGWINLMRPYSGRDLTFSSDKLPAVAGLAKAVVAGNPWLYLAGIRRTHMHRDLIWAIRENRREGVYRLSKASLLESLEAPDLYLAPSWSWASRRQELEQVSGVSKTIAKSSKMDRYGHVRKEYQEVGAWTLTSTLNPFGEVVGGLLVLEGLILPITSLRQNLENGWSSWVAISDNEDIAEVILDWSLDGEEAPSSNGLSLLLIGSCPDADPPTTGSENDYAKNSEDTDHDEAVLERRIGGSEINSIDAVSELCDTQDEGAAVRGRGSSEQEDNGCIPEANIDTQGPAPSADLLSRAEADAGTEFSFSPSGSAESSILIQTDQSAERIAYGIIIYPSTQAGKYLRVGIFTSLPRYGGLRKFHGREAVRVEIV